MKAPTLKETLVDTRTALGVLEEGGVPDYPEYVSHPTDPTPLYWKTAIALDYVPGGQRIPSNVAFMLAAEPVRTVRRVISDRGLSFRVHPSE